ncbi:MAG TPA: FAD-dependent oxidoreductase [Marmoricola sp.]|nr:FAD-dependent oxidoreductase [Marmoricola sp.]
MSGASASFIVMMELVKPHATAYERNAPDPRLVEQALAVSRQSVFWQEEAGPTVGYPQLTASLTADLVVVGGGYLGLWSALLAKLRDPSRRVVLLEAETIGWAASGRNGGFCEASITHGDTNGQVRWPAEFPVLKRLGVENLVAFEQNVHDLGIDCQWERTGVLEVAVEPHQVGWLQEYPSPMGAEETRAIINSPLFLGGDLNMEIALVQPARLARELARVASERGVEIYENSAATGLHSDGRGVSTSRAGVRTDQVLLATNVFPGLLRRTRPLTVPVYDYIVMTEPLSSEQMDAIGWSARCGLADMANQFHYSRLTADNRILYGGYDAIYHAGKKVRPEYENRPETFHALASQFMATFPQLEDVRFTHRWAGAIDTCTRFAAFYGTAKKGRVAYAAGFTGLGVGATRFAAAVLLDLLAGAENEKTQLEMVRRKPMPFPPEPIASIGINLTRRSLDRADHRRGQRDLFLRALDNVGLGFDS